MILTVCATIPRKKAATSIDNHLLHPKGQQK